MMPLSCRLRFFLFKDPDRDVFPFQLKAENSRIVGFTT